jgi:hypothetical protein
MQILHRMGYITPGYYYDSAYPPIRGICWASPNTLTLTNPGPIDHTYKFPIPVTFYQDLQQEEFWTVGVRLFGFPLLQYRAPREGLRINYHYFFDWSTRKYVYFMANDEVRLSGFHPLQASSNSIRTKVHRLEMMIHMTPYQRAAMAFGQDILKSAQEEEAYWTNYTAQEAAVKQIFVQAARPGTTEAERAELIVSMTRSIAQAAYHHQYMVSSTVSGEQASGSIAKDRRDRLLAWNRGSRIFTCELISCCLPGTDDNSIHSLQDILVGLEMCRMKLYSPINGPHDSADFAEYGEIIFAKNTPLLRRLMCNKILLDNGSSMFAKCCANIMICALDADVEDGWQNRRLLLTMNIALLKRFKSPNVKDWIPPLDEWEQYALQERNKIDLLYQPRAEQPVPPANAPEI